MLVRIAAVLILAGPLGAGAAEPPKVTLALVGGRIVDGFEGKPIDDGVILIAGERLAAVGPRSQVRCPRGSRRSTRGA